MIRPVVTELTQPIATPLTTSANIVARYSPTNGLVNRKTSTAMSFARASIKVRQCDNMSLPNDYPAVCSDIVWLEGNATSYYPQTYSVVNGAIVTSAPTTQTITLPSTGSYVLWIKGSVSLSATIAAGTAVGTGWGTLTSSGYLGLNITTAGTVTVTVANGSAGDLVQLTTGVLPTSYIPTPTASPVTRASEGSDTSNNGLTLPLSQAMIDSLTGELLDGSTAWTHASGTAPTYSGSKRILTYSGALTSSDYHALNATLAIDKQVEVVYTISGYAAGSVALGFGTAAGATRNANGTYTERGTLTTNTNFYVNATGFTGVINIISIRRVLESGQTNPGEGTVLCGVFMPYSTTVIPASTWIGIVTPDNIRDETLLFIGNSGGSFIIYCGDHTAGGYAKLNLGTSGLLPGIYVIIAQFSAVLGRMRVGLFNPTTGALTWSSPSMAGATTYRGFLPITSTGGQRMRWFYGGGNFPVGIGEMVWSDSLLSDDTIEFLAQGGEL